MRHLRKDQARRFGRTLEHLLQSVHSSARLLHTEESAVHSVPAAAVLFHSVTGCEGVDQLTRQPLRPEKTELNVSDCSEPRE